MKLATILFERSFKIANFPSEDNPNLPGTGERTIYSLLPVNKSGGEGFRIFKQTHVVASDKVKTLQPGDRVFFTPPVKLYRANELDQKGTSYYVRVGIGGPEKEKAIGFIPISVIEKPSKITGRVITGASGQDQVFEYIKNTYGQDRVVEKVGGAKIGSKTADLVVMIDNDKLQFEIKNASTASAPITFYDKTVRRGGTVHDIDSIIAAYTGNPKMTFEQYIDQQRTIDKTIGFPGDPDVTAKSGSFPRIQITQSDPAMKIAYDAIIQHFAEGGDTHFAINHGNGNVTIYYTGYGVNPIKAPKLPIPKSILMDTYGGAYKGGMRVGVKVKL